MHIINEKLNRAWGNKATICNESCEYWKFPHMDIAWVLSDVYSVPKGDLCYEYRKKKE